MLLCCLQRRNKDTKQNKMQSLTESEVSTLLFHADGAVYKLALRAGRRPKPRWITGGSN